MASSGIEVPKEAVIAGSVRVGGDAIRVKKQSLPARAVIPLGTPGGDRQISPAIGDAHCTEVDVAGAGADVGQQRVGSARVAVAHDELVNVRRIGHQLQGPNDAEWLMDGVPSGRQETTGGRSPASIGDAVFCRPREWACSDREAVMHGPEATPYRGHRCRWVGSPPITDRVLAGDRGRNDPRPFLVEAVIHDSGHANKSGGPPEADHLSLKVHAAPHRRPLDETKR